MTDHGASDQRRDHRGAVAGLQLAAGSARRGRAVQGTQEALVGTRAGRRAERASGIRERRPGRSRQWQQSQRLFEQDGNWRRWCDRDCGSARPQQQLRAADRRKGQTRLDGFDDRIISLYARGLSVREIQAHLQELYGVEVSPDLISRVTDAVLEEVRDWQNRPLDPVYPVICFDALRVKIRDEGLVRNKAVY